jgi:hypothetical protein
VLARRPPRARSACELHRPDCPPAPAPAPTLFARCPALHLHRSIPLRRPQPQLALHGLIQIADRDAGDATPRSEINAIKLIDATHKAIGMARAKPEAADDQRDFPRLPDRYCKLPRSHLIPAPMPAQPVRLPATALSPSHLKSIDEHPDRRDRAPAHLFDHLAPGRRRVRVDACLWLLAPRARPP